MAPALRIHGLAYILTDTAQGSVMGYHVACSGAELIQRLCTDPDRFLGRPHALHMMALCTMVDDEVVDWLMQYEMALDSLTGPDAAFLLFYNEAELRATASPAPDHENTPTVQRVQISAEVLRGGTHAVDEVVRYQAGIWRSRDILVQSMTYESDAIARELGILDRLPCIVLFDDPRSDEFYLLPLDDPGDILSEIRKLLAAYQKGEANTEYFKALREWHEANDRLTMVRTIAERLKAEYFAPGGQSAYKKADERLARAEAELLAGRQKAFRQQVNLVWSHDPPGMTWPEIRRISDRIAELRRVAAALEHGKGDRAASHASAMGVDWPTNDLPDLAQALTREADSLTEQLMTKLGRFAETATDGEPEWQRAERACRNLQYLLRQQLEILGTIPRPSVRSYVGKVISRRRRKSASQIVRLSATKALDRGPNLLDAVSKGINLLSK